MTTHFPVIRAIEIIMGLQPGSGSLQDMGGFYPAQADGNGAGNVFVADYRNFLGVASSHQPSAFATFWGVTNDCTPTDTDSLFKQLEHTRCIVLIESPPAQAEGISRHPSKTEYAKHLRAADWALAYCARLAKGAAAIATKTVAAPMVIVLDLYGAGDSDAAESFNIAGLSCLKVFSARNGLHHIDAFTTAIQKAKEFKNVTVKTEDIKRLTRQWSSSLADASGDDDEIGRSHYLNNLLGPLALAVGLEPVGQLNGLRQWVTKSIPRVEDCDVAGRRALMNALEWNGRGSQKPDANLDLSSKKLNLASLPIPGRELRVLVLDDQIEDGWAPIIAHALGMLEIDKDEIEPSHDAFEKIATNIDANISLWITNDPNNMLKILEQKEDYKPGFPDQLRFTEPYPGDQDTNFDEILMLDLRLFADQGRKSSLSQYQMAFEARLQKALAPKENWNDDPHDPQRLTGLARLVAQRDYTYPVVIWSSTGQRHIIDSLSEYKNIETGLRKPKFDTYGHKSEEFLHSFAEALRTAQGMNRSRHWMNQSLVVPHVKQVKNELFTRIQNQVSAFKNSTVFIFFDESGRAMKGAAFKQGGLAIVVSSNEDAWEKNLQKLQQLLQQKKIELQDTSGRLVENISIEADLKKPYFKSASHPNMAKKNAITYYANVEKFLNCIDHNKLSAICIPVALLDLESPYEMKIDARNIEGLQRLTLGAIAAVTDGKKIIQIRLEVDGRRIPLSQVYASGINSNNNLWHDEKDLRRIRESHTVACKELVQMEGHPPATINYTVGGDWFPPDYSSNFSLKKSNNWEGAPGVEIMSSSVQSIVVHGVVAAVLNRCGAKLKVQFVGAKSTHHGTTIETKVMRNIGDFVPRFAYPMNKPEALDESFLKSEFIVSHVQNGFSSKADRLLDVFFSNSADVRAERALIQIAEILGRSNAAPQINSFESIAITRLYSEIEPILSDKAFWNLAQLLPVL